MNAPAPLPAVTPRARWATRHDGWTPDRRRQFLEALAEGHTVGGACGLVGLSVASAYALRHRADGADFALGWQAALLIGRAHVADTLLARAIDGQVDTYTRADGQQVTRHRHDNRLAMQLLARLDRLAEAEAGAAADHAARVVAQDFPAFLDTIERGEGPARAALFIARRDAAMAGTPDLAAVASLARADLYLRTGASAADDIAVADLDPAKRAGWTAAQWARAEAAGLVALAPDPDPDPDPASGTPSPIAGDSQLHQLDVGNGGADADEPPVWWDDAEEEWRTAFPPPDDFCGRGARPYGDPDYERSLTIEEEDAVDLLREAAIAPRRAAHIRERDAWFAAARAGALAAPATREGEGEDAGAAAAGQGPADPGRTARSSA